MLMLLFELCERRVDDFDYGVLLSGEVQAEFLSLLRLDLLLLLLEYHLQSLNLKFFLFIAYQLFQTLTFLYFKLLFLFFTLFYLALVNFIDKRVFAAFPTSIRILLVYLWQQCFSCWLPFAGEAIAQGSLLLASLASHQILRRSLHVFQPSKLPLIFKLQ